MLLPRLPIIALVACALVWSTFHCSTANAQERSATRIRANDSVDANFLRPRGDDAKILQAMRDAFTQANDTEGVELVNKLERRPLVRWFVIRSVREELAGANLVTAQGQIDWDAIGDFFVKIAPIILEILKMFLG